jgi:hypothetical protein
MGRIPSCELCQLPVLELEGQFRILQPYDAKSDHPASEIAGTCHTTCLATSPHHTKWAEWTITSFLRRGYTRGSLMEGWQLLSLTRVDDVVAVHESGCTVGYKGADLKNGKRRDGGLMLPERREMHYTLDDTELVARWQGQLASTGSIPLESIVQDLGISDRIRWPQALAGGRWMNSRRTRADWGTGHIGAVCEYNVFVPTVVATTK